MSNNAPFGIADVVLVRDGSVLLVRQRKESAHGLWSYPGGRIEPGETPEQAVVREVLEELGAELVNPRFFRAYTLTTPFEPLQISTFTGEIGGEIHLNTDELMGHGWFGLETMAMMSDLRSNIVLQQARDVTASLLS